VPTTIKAVVPMPTAAMAPEGAEDTKPCTLRQARLSQPGAFVLSACESWSRSGVIGGWAA
jgi:hypothetical protein